MNNEIRELEIGIARLEKQAFVKDENFLEKTIEFVPQTGRLLGGAKELARLALSTPS